MVLYLSPSTKHIKSSHCKSTKCFAVRDVFPRHSHDEGKIGMRFVPRALRDYFLARCFTRCLTTKKYMDDHGSKIWNIPVRLTKPRCCWYVLVQKDRSLPHFSSPVADSSKDMSSKSQWMSSNGITTCGHEFKGYMKEKRVNGLPAPEDMWYTSRMRLLA